LTNAEDIAELFSVLPQLAEADRHIITLHHLDELSHEQIAAQLAITVVASRTRLARAMRELKRLAVNGGEQ
jgi:RNA polymerase sigma factor (sigma-70 family)